MRLTCRNDVYFLNTDKPFLPFILLDSESQKKKDVFQVCVNVVRSWHRFLLPPSCFPHYQILKERFRHFDTFSVIPSQPQSPYFPFVVRNLQNLPVSCCIKNGFYVYVRDVDCSRYEVLTVVYLQSVYIYTLQTTLSQAYRNLESYVFVFLESREAYQRVICLRRPRRDFSFLSIVLIINGFWAYLYVLYRTYYIFLIFIS